MDKNKDSKSLRYAMMLPLMLMIASFVACGFSYRDAKTCLTDDLNDAMVTLANENKEIWARQDTIAALRNMRAAIDKPIVYQASDLKFRHDSLKREAYYSLTLVDSKSVKWSNTAKTIESDSIMIISDTAPDGVAIQLKGFADCSMASVFAAADTTLPGVLFTLSLLSFVTVMFRRKEQLATAETPCLSNIKLTPMQRQLVQMLFDAPDNKVDKSELCTALWGNKSNAEESLYTLVKRTKSALAEADIEIVCNRGESYELRINN